MKSRLLSLVAGLCSVWLFSPAALADPFVFTFDMPAFDTFGNIGVTSVLELTVDNGGSSSLSQTWDSDQIIALSTDITGASSSTRLQNGVQVAAVTTDAAGVPTLDFGPSNVYIFGLDGGGLDLIQVGRDCDYAVFTGGVIDGAAGCSPVPIWPITGSAVAPVDPDAAVIPTLGQWGLALLALLLAAVAVPRLRKTV